LRDILEDSEQLRIISGMGRRRTTHPRSAFGALLDRQLADRHLSPAEFAKRADLSLSHVYQLLRGDRPDPRGTTLRKVASALGLSESELGAPQADTRDVENAQTGPPVDRATFFGLMSAFPSGVTVVTTVDERGQPRGLTCTSTCSLSAQPPLLLVSLDNRSGTLAVIRASRRFVVNYLLAGRGELSNQFAVAGVDRWKDVAWRPNGHGIPVLHADSLAYTECRLVNAIEAGDHTIVVGRVEGGRAPAPGSQPLIYFRRGYATLRG
jgi:flavin reductase (DIM6/NTAB) family NADH-FMN oxidoreductase RutF